MFRAVSFALVQTIAPQLQRPARPLLPFLTSSPSHSSYQIPFKAQDAEVEALRVLSVSSNVPKVTHLPALNGTSRSDPVHDPGSGRSNPRRYD